MKYLVMMFGDQASMLEARSVEWVREMVRFMRDFSQELQDAGELVAAEGLADASQAKTVRIVDGVPAVTDGPFAESKESMAGYWIVDVEKEERALELASRVVAYTHGPIEVRQIAAGPPEL